jgi:hypothetical protein
MSDLRSRLAAEARKRCENARALTDQSARAMARSESLIDSTARALARRTPSEAESSADTRRSR